MTIHGEFRLRPANNLLGGGGIGSMMMAANDAAGSSSGADHITNPTGLPMHNSGLAHRRAVSNEVSTLHRIRSKRMTQMVQQGASPSSSSSFHQQQQQRGRPRRRSSAASRFGGGTGGGSGLPGSSSPLTGGANSSVGPVPGSPRSPRSPSPGGGGSSGGEERRRLLQLQGSLRAGSSSQGGGDDATESAVAADPNEIAAEANLVGIIVCKVPTLLAPFLAAQRRRQFLEEQRRNGTGDAGGDGSGRTAFSATGGAGGATTPGTGSSSTSSTNDFGLGGGAGGVGGAGGAGAAPPQAGRHLDETIEALSFAAANAKLGSATSYGGGSSGSSGGGSGAGSGAGGELDGLSPSSALAALSTAVVQVSVSVDGGRHFSLGAEAWPQRIKDMLRRYHIPLNATRDGSEQEGQSNASAQQQQQAQLMQSVSPSKQASLREISAATALGGADITGGGGAGGAAAGAAMDFEGITLGNRFVFMLPPRIRSVNPPVLMLGLSQQQRMHRRSAFAYSANPSGRRLSSLTASSSVSGGVGAGPGNRRGSGGSSVISDRGGLGGGLGADLVAQGEGTSCALWRRSAASR